MAMGVCKSEEAAETLRSASVDQDGVLQGFSVGIRAMDVEVGQMEGMMGDLEGVEVEREEDLRMDNSATEFDDEEEDTYAAHALSITAVCLCVSLSLRLCTMSCAHACTLHTRFVGPVDAG